MAIQDDFASAAARVKELPERPSNEALLELYGLFKQATEGDVSGEGPGLFDFKGQAKHQAWSERRGMSTEDAMRAYVELVDRLAGV